MPWRIWTMPSSPSPCSASAQPSHEGSPPQKVRKSLLAGESNQCLYSLLGGLSFPTEQMDSGSKDEGMGKAKRDAPPLEPSGAPPGSSSGPDPDSPATTSPRMRSSGKPPQGPLRHRERSGCDGVEGHSRAMALFEVGVGSV